MAKSYPDDRERSFAELANLIAGRKTQHLENRILCKDGSYQWLSWFAVPDRGLVYSVGRNITSLKQAQEQLDTFAAADLQMIRGKTRSRCHDGVDRP